MRGLESDCCTQSISVEILNKPYFVQTKIINAKKNVLMLYYFFFLNLLGSTSWGTCRGGWDISFFWESTPGEGPILFEEGFKKKKIFKEIFISNFI